jgi:amino-acid N-acetyltransferase
MNVDLDGATIRRAAPEDAAAIELLLVAAGLPPDGVREALRGFAVVSAGETVVAAAGLERYDDAVLLRSVVVAPGARGAGLGRRLVEERLALAALRGATAAYLLTTTAEEFFGALGFAPVDRERVPAGIRASAEFTSLCPASAVAMRRSLAIVADVEELA